MAKTKYYAFANNYAFGDKMDIRFIDEEECYDTKEEAVNKAKEYIDAFCSFEDEPECIILEVKPVCRVGYVKHFEQTDI